MKISDTRVVGGRDKGEGNVMGLGINVVEADQQRARVKRRKLSVSELCMRLGKLEVHHSRRKDLRHASFRELVAVLPDLAQQSTSSEASRSHPNKCALLTWRPTLKGVKVDVSAPRIYGDPAILMAGHSAVPSPCGPILLSPNGQVTLLDVTRAGSHGSRWVRLPEFPMPSLHYAKACLIGSTLIVFGGASKTRKLTNHTFLFSLTHGRWVTFRTTGTPPAPRVHHAAIEVSGEYLFVHGGTAKNHILSDTYRLHVRTGRWVRCRCRGAPALAYHSADLYGRHVVVFGGTNGGELFSDLYLLNLKTLVWSTVTPKADCKRPSARMAHSSAILGDRLFIAGGHNPGFGPDHVFTDIWSFHFPTRTWDNHPTKLPNHFSGTLTFVHHSPALLPSAGFGVFTLLLVGVQNPRARTRGKGSGSGRDRERKRDGSSGNHRGRMSVEEKDASNSLFAALTIKF
uniref:Uncharacterized protein n=1 Tax=Amorphochlora amoebiformis TaxID=1561963 RepID=A0A7S0DPM8_9EUKA|mmetsp:Transcript_4992/g.7577  ORF Transcript_4992/g.7577 Transcript_4992/m.7577 type:complete len:457 (+) Transcript_4992:2-1372(+)